MMEGKQTTGQLDKREMSCFQTRTKLHAQLLLFCRGVGKCTAVTAIKVDALQFEVLAQQLPSSQGCC